MTVTKLIEDLKVLLIGYCEELNVTEEAYNVPKKMPSICLDVVGSTSIQIAFGTLTDERKRIEITYYDKVPEVGGKILFLQEIDDIKLMIINSEMAKNDILIKNVSSRKGTHQFGEGKWFKEIISIECDIEV